MTASLPFPSAPLSAQQANDLILLVDLEARWENLRMDQSAARGKTSSRDELKHIQRAYEAFHDKLVAYNKQFKPAHVPELLLNNASRLQLWNQRMKGLFLLVLQSDSQASCPVHLVEKAYRCADRIADRAHKERFPHLLPSDSLAATVQDLDKLIAWCDSLVPLAAAS